jgi:hypothetical protein
MWDDYDKRPFSYLLSEEGQKEYAESFDYLAGEKINWQKILADKIQRSESNE